MFLVPFSSYSAVIPFHGTVSDGSRAAWPSSEGFYRRPCRGNRDEEREREDLGMPGRNGILFVLEESSLKTFRRLCVLSRAFFVSAIVRQDFPRQRDVAVWREFAISDDP